MRDTALTSLIAIRRLHLRNKQAGFTVREEAVFDIGNGYVMDDYVMQKNVIREIR